MKKIIKVSEHPFSIGKANSLFSTFKTKITSAREEYIKKIEILKSNLLKEEKTLYALDVQFNDVEDELHRLENIGE